MIELTEIEVYITVVIKDRKEIVIKKNVNNNEGSAKGCYFS